MRMMSRNKQQMYYALHIGEEPIYQTDEYGELIVDYVDEEGNIYYRDTGFKRQVYSSPVLFYGNLATSGGELFDSEFGLNQSEYEAVLMVDKGLLPITETSLIWHNSMPKADAYGKAIGDSADYAIVKVSPSLNVDKYVLKKKVK